MAAPTALKISFDVCIWRDADTGQWIAEARPLEVMAVGDDESDACKNLDGLLQAFLETTRDMGTLDLILQESGYRLVSGVWEPPIVKSSRRTSEFVV